MNLRQSSINFPISQNGVKFLHNECTRENDNTLCITRYATRDQNFRYNELNRQKIVGFQPQTSCFQTAERFRRGKFQWRSYGKFIRTESGENSTGNYSEHRRALPSDELWTKFPFSSDGRHSLWTLYITQLARSRRDRSVHTCCERENATVSELRLASRRPKRRNVFDRSRSRWSVFETQKWFFFND